MTLPNLPIITLRHGAWSADIFDPRPDPAVLGARFVHGGYIARLFRSGRELTGRSHPAWTVFDGLGLPETFESGLGWSLATEGEEFLRPGAGRIRRDANPNEHHAWVPLTSVLEWDIEISADRAVFRTSDMIRGRREYGYHLERDVRLDNDGLVSTTTFETEGGQATLMPISWYAHPYFPQSSSTGIGLILPDEAAPTPNPYAPWMRKLLPSAVRGCDGAWRLGDPEGGRAAFGGLWGRQVEATLLLDPAHGGGRLGISLDRPLDHAVLWGNALVASYEAKWSRTWLHRERASWSIRYRWLAD
jgi:hypothetical protein